MKHRDGAEEQKTSALAVETGPLPTTLPHNTLTPISEESSPLGDISRLSGFPELSQFNFGLGDDESPLRSPTAYDRRSLSLSQPPLLLSPQNPRFSTSTRRHSVVLGSPRHPQQPTDVVNVIEVDEEPPPYTRFAEPHVHPRNIQQEAPARPHPVRRILGAARGLFHQRPATLPDPEIPRVLSMNSITLADLRSGNGSAGEAARRRHEARERRKRMWRGWWFCPSGGCLGFGQGPTSIEKQRKSRALRCWLISGLVVLALIAIIVGAVVGTTSKRRNNASTPQESNSSDTPALPLGNVVVRPFRTADRLSTCVARPYQWSCQLPPDTEFPMTNATNDGFKVPEFRFTIKRRDPSNPGSDSSWIPVPRNVPNITDYENVAEVDEVTDAGEDTDFYITLITSTGDVNNDSKREIIKEESHMLPAVAANQPLRLFDRDLDTENYGFHMYFDKTIQFANSSRLLSSRDTGGVSAEDSRYRIQWTNTRFKVTIFTKEIGKIVESTADTEIDLPVDIWEDRVGGDRKGRTVTAWVLNANGTVGERAGIVEKKGVNTEVRGCYCHWSNYHTS
jgi:hypothetical protein